MNTFSGIVDTGRVDINKETTQGLYTPYVMYMQSQPLVVKVPNILKAHNLLMFVLSVMVNRH